MVRPRKLTKHTSCTSAIAPRRWSRRVHLQLDDDPQGALALGLGDQVIHGGRSGLSGRSTGCRKQHHSKQERRAGPAAAPQWSKTVTPHFLLSPRARCHRGHDAVQQPCQTDSLQRREKIESGTPLRDPNIEGGQKCGRSAPVWVSRALATAAVRVTWIDARDDRDTAPRIARARSTPPSCWPARYFVGAMGSTFPRGRARFRRSRERSRAVGP